MAAPVLAPSRLDGPEPRRGEAAPPSGAGAELRPAFAAATAGSVILTLAVVLVGAAVAVPAGSRPLVLAWGIAAVIAVAALGAALTVRGTLGRTVAAPVGALLILTLGCDGGMVAAAGGVARPLWLAFVPAVLLIAAVVDTPSAVAAGVLGGVSLYAASAVAGPLGSGGAERLAVIAPLLPLAAALSAHLSQAARAQALAVEEHRAALERDVATLSALLTQVAAGNLTQVPALPEGSAPVTAVAVAFADTLLALRRLVRRVATVGQRLAGNAAELAGTAAEHASGVEQQTAAVHETRTTIEELAATAAQIADTAERVARYAGETLSHVQQGGAAVTASVEAMQRIAGRVDGITQRAQGLDARMGRITTILEVIDDMGRQTNLLAFHAAVEAARAGEHGRGFGQVADEVRLLAERARECTAQVRRIVTDATAQMAATIATSAQGAADVRAGQELTQGVAAVLTRITAMTTDTTAAAQEISVATQQQRLAADEVVAAMGQVAAATGAYETVSARYVAAAARLDSLAGELQDSIGRFQVS